MRGIEDAETPPLGPSRWTTATHQRLVDAIDALPSAILIFDAEDRLVFAGDRFSEMFPAIQDLVIPGTPLADLFEAIPAEGESEIRLADERWIRQVVRRTADGGRVCILEDVTEAKRRQGAQFQIEKIEVAERLTDGIAAEFSDLLTVILSNAGTIAGGSQRDDISRTRARAIEMAGLHAAEMTRQLMAFSRRQPLAARPIDVNVLVGGLGELIKLAIGTDVDMALALGADLPRALADPGQVQNAILHLVANANDAMPDGGRLTIETASVFLDAAARRDGQVKPGRYLMVAVSDTGTGMEADVQHRAFEPFFTTKGTGKGSGLGLSVVYGFARQSGGHVRIDSQEGLGTTVTLYLPEASAEPGPLAR